MAGIFDSFSTGFQQGRQIRDDRMKRNALLQAGEAYQAGNYKGAANALFAQDPGAAMQIQNYGMGLERQQKADELAGQERDQGRAQATLKAFGQMAQALKPLPMEARLPAARQYAERLAPTLGMQPQQLIDMMSPDDFTDTNIDSTIALSMDPEALMKLQQQAVENERAQTKLGLDERRVAAIEARAMQSGERDSGPQWRPATQQEQAAYGTQQPLLIDDRTGNVKPIPGAGGVMASADQRGRVALSLPNIIQAQNDLATVEGKGNRNVFNEQWGARVAEAIPFDGGTVARTIGGADYQAYDQASRTFEAAIMPIFSGSAVTESEAQRFVRANLPRMGDSAESLKRKALNRARIINGAAELVGQPAPYPEAGSWKPSGASAAQGAPVEKVVRGPDGKLMVTR